MYIARDGRFFVRVNRNTGSAQRRGEVMPELGVMQRIPLSGVQGGWSTNGNVMGLVTKFRHGFQLLTITVHGNPATHCEVRGVYRPDVPGGAIIVPQLGTQEPLTIRSYTTSNPRCEVFPDNIFVRQQREQN
jgi:hypothetical protein